MTAAHGEPSSAKEEPTHIGWTMDDSEFGSRLALVRQRMRWNIKEAAKECGLPAASWGTWENGVMPRRYTEVCEKIAQRTGADYLWLMAGSSRPGPRNRRQEAGPPATAHYFQLTERTSDHIHRPPARPRDTRPNGQVAPVAPGRSAYLPRGTRKKRDR
jgi:transcriptional regulator with XRE-family HTH domain